MSAGVEEEHREEPGTPGIASDERSATNNSDVEAIAEEAGAPNVPTAVDAQTEPFDFKAHGQEAVSQYIQLRDFYKDLSQSVRDIVFECIRREKVEISAVDWRAKDAKSFEKKASAPSDDDPDVPKYNDPLRQITDLAGVRIITFFPSKLSAVHDILEREFLIVEHSDKRATLVREERFGYQSIHYLVKFKPARIALPEYERFSDAIAEIQVRTILQHAWAEIEHDIQYKAASIIPTELRRRFSALAGLLEIADREFQAIQDEDVKVTASAKASVAKGEYEVEVTPTALKAYLDRRLGVDGRISEFSYQWTARLLKSLGFKTLDQVDQCINGYNGDQICQIADGYRQGQTRRFERMLLAGMGEKYIERHPYSEEDWFSTAHQDILGDFERGGIPIKNFDPLIKEV